MDALHQTAYTVADMLIAGMFLAAFVGYSLAGIVKILGKVAYKAGERWAQKKGKDTHDLLDNSDEMPF